MLPLRAVALLSLALAALGAPTPSVRGSLTVAANVPTVTLSNTASKGMTMPAIGLGTGGYSGNNASGYGGYPECWSSLGGCGPWVQTAVTTWLQVGGRRIDSANSYQNQADVGIALKNSGVPREQLWILSKTGPSNPLGYGDTLRQFAQILTDLQTDYVDMLLIHWPYSTVSQGNVSHNNTHESSDPLCNTSSTSTFNASACRISTWRAMLDIFQSGGARAVGVSNYNVSHFLEIEAAGLPLPSLNQIPFHLYTSAVQQQTIYYSAARGITTLGYSPFGVPDFKHYPVPQLPAASQLQHPDVVRIAQRLGATPAQVLLAWQWALGIPVNPRSMSQAHMVENLEAFALQLSTDDIHVLSSVAQDMCSFDPTWYECA